MSADVYGITLPDMDLDEAARLIVGLARQNEPGYVWPDVGEARRMERFDAEHFVIASVRPLRRINHEESA